MKISRNDPCPCGSGKKYKKCCVDKYETFDGPPDPTEDNFIIGDIPPPPKMPVFSESFFKKVEPGLSAYTLINSCILRPQIETMAAQFSNKQDNRGKNEGDKIKACTETLELVLMLKTGINTLNHVFLRDKFLEKPSESASSLVGELQNAVSDTFVEISVRVIALAKVDVSEDLMRIIGKHDKSIYQISLLCLLLGYQKNPSVVQFLWNYYSFFRSQYPDQKFWQGPFYGLWEKWASATFDNK